MRRRGQAALSLALLFEVRAGACGRFGAVRSARETTIPWTLAGCDYPIEHPEMLVASAATQDPARISVMTASRDRVVVEFSARIAQCLKAALVDILGVADPPPAKPFPSHPSRSERCIDMRSAGGSLTIAAASWTDGGHGLRLVEHGLVLVFEIAGDQPVTLGLSLPAAQELLQRLAPPLALKTAVGDPGLLEPVRIDIDG